MFVKETGKPRLERLYFTTEYKKAGILNPGNLEQLFFKQIGHAACIAGMAGRTPVVPSQFYTFPNVINLTPANYTIAGILTFREFSTKSP